MDGWGFSNVVFIMLVVLVLVTLKLGINIVPQSENWLVERLGKFNRDVWIQATYNPILDAAGKPIYAMEAGKRVSSNAYSSQEATLGPIVRRLRAATAASSGTDLNGRAAQFAARQVRQRLAEFLEQRLPQGTPVVRVMPNTPALVGLGQTGLFARAAVTPTDKQWVERVVTTTGALLWVNDEALLDAVTAISGSGPAYVFFFIEAMVEAGVKMGLSADQAKQLAIGTFMGASQLAHSASRKRAHLYEAGPLCNQAA